MTTRKQQKMDCNESVVVMSALRYALGRGSYAVGCVCDFIKSNKNRLTESNIEVIIRDIQEYVQEHPDMRYKQDWLDVVEFLTPTP